MCSVTDSYTVMVRTAAASTPEMKRGRFLRNVSTVHRMELMCAPDQMHVSVWLQNGGIDFICIATRKLLGNTELCCVYLALRAKAVKFFI